MVKFLKCAVLSELENADNLIEEQIVILNEKFGERECLCHPNQIWHLLMDLTKTNIYEFHYPVLGHPKNPSCNFWRKLYKDNVKDCLPISMQPLFLHEIINANNLL